MLLVAAIFTLFAVVRLLYWRSINEQPFSDMADYYSIAQQVWKTFSFDHNPFWRSYKPPGMPIIAAVVVGPLPGDAGLWMWRVLVGTLTFLSALLLSVQLSGLCRSRWIGSAFLVIVSLSKSSIFWSYRFSTESLTEAVTYVVIAFYLWFARDVQTKAAWHAGLLGAACITLALIRPNMMPILAIVPAGIVLRWLIAERRLSSRMGVQVVAFIAGVMILWTPWLYRGVRLYGELVPFSTQGPYSFLWEAGGISYNDPELGTRTVNAEMLQAEAPTRFKTDKEAANLASLAGKQWLRQLGYREFMGLVFKRIGVMVQEREMSLSKTRRSVLFSSPLDWFLFDKSPLAVCLSIAGLVAGAMAFGLEFAVFGMLVVSPTLLSACFMGEPRMLEPMLPLFFFAAFVAIYLLLSPFRGFFRRQRMISWSA